MKKFFKAVWDTLEEIGQHRAEFYLRNRRYGYWD